MQENKNVKASWFGIPMMINEKFKNNKQKILESLDKKGIETRPIISGNFANQPAAKLYKLNKKNIKFNNAQKIQDLGFLIWLHTIKMSKSKLDFIHDVFFMIDHI